MFPLVPLPRTMVSELGKEGGHADYLVLYSFFVLHNTFVLQSQFFLPILFNDVYLHNY